MSIGDFNTDNVSLHTTVALWVFAGVTVGLGVYSAVCPPSGIIDKSIFEFGALMAGFATLAIAREAIKEGIGKGVGVKYTHKDTKVEITSEHEQEQRQNCSIRVDEENE